ncbi:hypothetical protein BOSE62_130669 [Bosea sp. 62]|uniref:hypothetical protein n=1 Tax=unclassified Bosea (in: a-proteobacteria) TaxID=2653178 RepID=UPI0012568ACF|nr:MULTISPECIES: hypothetical protein [unclassified Bosea (in: a-proteobacteria)]CAD5255755.1 hypothetical protein BOSE7B_120689 [Bosea sp. 7B]CAD5275019.1 hypothetical protein BOSE21B_30223 [Bosea sp. 21B]CAD5276159.1 hypothetical protein BOSE46_30084 [Bosea sp. 46]VVT60038.1 hypothetical protein BOS5A_210829 [Bosea sp. EC-HK365B]VXB52709.1 hypothetical protein BOSE62_130669 [Bosea sp. 62]
MTEQTPATPPEFVDVYPTEGRRVRIETGELLPFGHVLRGVRRSIHLLRLERDGDVALKPHQPEPADVFAPSGAPASDLPAADPQPTADAGGSKPRKS